MQNSLWTRVIGNQQETAIFAAHQLKSQILDHVINFLLHDNQDVQSLVVYGYTRRFCGKHPQLRRREIPSTLTWIRTHDAAPPP